MMVFVVSWVLSVATILLSVMMFTLLERKILSYSQSRLGPNKISFLGVGQALIDGVKLMLNEKSSSAGMNKFIYFSGPMSILLVMFFLWSTMPFIFPLFMYKYSLLFIMVCFGLSIYSNLFSGWASNSKFSSLGAFRGLSQTISCELSLIFVLLCFFIGMTSLCFSMNEFLGSSNTGLMSPLILVWLINILAEVGRAPLDFMEGESELVSGFNTEYSSSGFAILFVGEYGLVIFFSMVTPMLITSGAMWNPGLTFLGLMFYLVMRSAYPRFRYDFLMDLAWVKLLPMVIFYLWAILLIL